MMKTNNNENWRTIKPAVQLASIHWHYFTLQQTLGKLLVVSRPAERRRRLAEEHALRYLNVFNADEQ